MTSDDIIKQLIDKIMILPDQTGLAKCAGFYMLYQGADALKQVIQEEREKNETEKRALQERINELEGELSQMRGAKRDG